MKKKTDFIVFLFTNKSVVGDFSCVFDHLVYSFVCLLCSALHTARQQNVHFQEQ